ncbi:uncharacterized protein C8Q71DRAFT_759768 [Rhodofomes roseus]|uniref:Secreted protein n=1 Tax=Rhodofomes roseus TaxID=34475 RepID=A0ABQ8KG74_9APHY|nr:uncharacterized protein C8Q71DRAFT_759768 [Rhodofomes roseus]KAH9836783.1 hypothetical protein C8Q71DRAFT_759768 [Rhodofomes roseus]
MRIIIIVPLLPLAVTVTSTWQLLASSLCRGPTPRPIPTSFIYLMLSPFRLSELIALAQRTREFSSPAGNYLRLEYWIYGRMPRL